MIFVAWFVSRWWWVTFPLNDSWTFGTVGLGAGAIFYDYVEINGYPMGWPFSRDTADQSFWVWKPRLQGRLLHPTNLVLPLWIPFVVLALPTSFLFAFGRTTHRREGVCSTCSYDVTGISPGKCPECGDPV